MAQGQRGPAKRALLRLGWKKLAILTLGSTIAACLVGATPPMGRVEFMLLDEAQKLVPHAVRAENRVVVVAIDDLSISADAYELGKWPWPRHVYQPVVEYLSRAEATCIGFDLYFQLEATDQPEHDLALVKSVLRSGNTCQAAAATDRRGAGMSDEAREDIASRFGLDCKETGRHFERLIIPFPALRDACDCLGQLNATRDPDGVTRRIHIIAGAEGVSLPCLGLAMWLWDKGLLPEDVQCTDKDGTVEVGDVVIPVDDQGRAVLRFGQKERRYVSFSSVLHAALAEKSGVEPDWRGGSLPPVDPSMFKDKWVIVALTASGLFDLVSTPMGSSIPGVEIQATALENIAESSFLRLSWFGWNWSAALIVAILAALILSAVSTSVALVLSVFVAVGYGAMDLMLLRTDFWLSLSIPMLALVFTVGTQVLIMYVAEERERRRYRQTFSRYVSKQVVEELLNDTDAIELKGEKREITVLFCDIRGFTTLSETKKPEEVVEILDEFLGAMVNEVFAEGGTLDKFLGDGMMVFYGAPGLQEDHADRAIRTGLAMRRRLRSLNVQWEQKGWPSLRLGVGINTGWAIVGSIGSKERMEYTAIGDTVNTASRVQSLNKELNTCVLVTKSTVESMQGNLPLRSLGTRAVRGRQQEVELYEPLDAEEGHDA